MKNVKTQMKLIFNVALILLVSVEIYAQNVQFDVTGRVNQVLSEERTSRNDLEVALHSRINDSMVIRNIGIYSQQENTTYTGKLGYELQGQLAWRLSNRISLKTGVGIQYTSFSQESSSEFLDFQSISFDTVISYINTNPGIIGSPCDSFENNYSDVGEVDRTIDQHILNLEIPIGIEYSIIPQMLFLNAGLFMQTPISSVRKREYVTTRSRIENEVVICRYEKVVEKNTTGADLNDLLFGCNMFIAYQMTKRIRLELGVKKVLTNLYIEQQPQVIAGNPKEFRPIYLSAGVNYLLDQS